MSHNQLNHRLILQQLQNFNQLVQSFQEISTIVNEHIRFTQQPYQQTHQQYHNQYRQYQQRNNNVNNSTFVNNPLHSTSNRTYDNNTNLNDDNSYVIRIDTLLPDIFQGLNLNSLNTRSNRNNRNSNIRIGYINQQNYSDISNIMQHYDILDIEHYQMIDEPTNDICPITRDRFYDDQNVSMITSCGHIFNKSSLNIWIANHNNCPYCRQSIYNNSSNNTHENSTNNY